jgi:hypothetical protein
MMMPITAKAVTTACQVVFSGAWCLMRIPPVRGHTASGVCLPHDPRPPMLPRHPHPTDVPSHAPGAHGHARPGGCRSGRRCGGLARCRRGAPWPSPGRRCRRSTQGRRPCLSPARWCGLSVSSCLPSRWVGGLWGRRRCRSRLGQANVWHASRPSKPNASLGPPAAAWRKAGRVGMRQRCGVS